MTYPLFPRSGATSTLYNVGDFIPQTVRGWDDYKSRLARYEILEGYYNNLAYHQIMQYAQQLKVTEQLYKHVRGVYNPTMRLVESYVAKVMGGVLDTQNGKSDAIPLDIATGNEVLREALIQLWRDSHWGQKKSLYVRYGAMKGDSFIKIVDDIHRKQVRLEPVDPAKVKSVEKDDAGVITKIVFEYYVRDYDENGNGYNRLVRETIDEEMFRIETRENIMINGLSVGVHYQPYHRHTNGRNEQVSEWPNDYGFVPVQHVLHKDMGMMFGAASIHGVQHKINELNDNASILNDGMRNQVNLPLVAVDAEVGTLDFGSDNSTNAHNRHDSPKKDTMRVLNLKSGGSHQAALNSLPATLNIADGLQNIINIEREIERDCPELSLHRIREGSQLTAPGVRSAYDDAIARYAEARGNYDTGLVEAQKMAVAIAGMRGYDGYQGFNLISLEDGTLDHSISKRPVISDSLGLGEQLDKALAGMQQNAPRIFYMKAGYSETEADDFVAAAESQQSQNMMLNPFQQMTETPPPEDSEETPDDVFDARLNSGVNETDLAEAAQLALAG